jgi:hypothetical protein
MYVRYVREVHRPNLMMVLSEAPLSFIAMAPPARKLWDDTRSRVYPRARRQSYVAPQRTAIVMSLSEMVDWVRLGRGVDDHGAEGSGGGLAAEVVYLSGQGCH